jgi:hypothetical protein
VRNNQGRANPAAGKESSHQRGFFREEFFTLKAMERQVTPDDFSRAEILTHPKKRLHQITVNGKI